MLKALTNRRGLLRAGFLGATSAALAGCDKMPGGNWVMDLLDSANQLTLATQRAILGRSALAPEYTDADISPKFKANGSTNPSSEIYKAMVENGFKDWKMKVDGLVDHPAEFSLADLKAMPSRTQITRHDCVEGWSCIGKWTGVPLSQVLERVGVKSDARYVVFHCADTMDDGDLNGPTPFYGTIDLVDAAHPQTILAYEMNGGALPVPHGAPLRLRLEQALGYKMSKYIMRIELVDSYAKFGDGKGGYWEDNGYDWYAGI